MKPSIIIVDDDEDISKILCHRLTKAGYDVTVALDGEQGLKIATRRPPALILLDVMLPGKSGFEVLSRLRQNHSTSKVPVILLTSRNQEEDVLQGLTAGANDYLTKPFSIPELLVRVKMHLKKR